MLHTEAWVNVGPFREAQGAGDYPASALLSGRMLMCPCMRHRSVWVPVCRPRVLWGLAWSTQNSLSFGTQVVFPCVQRCDPGVSVSRETLAGALGAWGTNPTWGVQSEAPQALGAAAQVGGRVLQAAHVLLLQTKYHRKVATFISALLHHWSGMTKSRNF